MGHGSVSPFWDSKTPFFIRIILALWKLWIWGYCWKWSALLPKGCQKSEIVGLQWNGIGCVGSVNDFEKNVKWLWDMYLRHWSEIRDMEVSHNKKWYQLNIKIMINWRWFPIKFKGSTGYIMRVLLLGYKFVVSVF